MVLTASLAGAEPYFFGFLKSAPNRPTLPKEEASRIQTAHLAHLTAMAEEGALVAAGPLANGGTFRGVIIYKTATLEEALQRANADPAEGSVNVFAEMAADQRKALEGEHVTVLLDWYVAEGVVPNGR